MNLSRLCAMSLAFGLASPSLWADSDGYYCAAPGYLAYELRFASGPDQQPPNGHTLFVLGLDGETIAQPLAVRLADFQVHGMRCTERTVELAGWDAVHVVDLGRDREPRLGRTLPRPQAGGAPPGFVETNLSAWASSVREGRAVAEIPLPPSGRDVEHLLEIRYGPHASREHCRYQVQTNLKRAAMANTPAVTVLLAEGDFRRDCH